MNIKQLKNMVGWRLTSGLSRLPVPTKQSKNGVSVGPGRIAPDAISAVSDAYYRLSLALSNAVVTGDYSLVERLINIIDSWADGDEEERKAYKIFWVVIRGFIRGPRNYLKGLNKRMPYKMPNKCEGDDESLYTNS